MPETKPAREGGRVIERDIYFAVSVLADEGCPNVLDLEEFEFAPDEDPAPDSEPPTLAR